jgi:hypothetical protein
LEHPFEPFDFFSFSLFLIFSPLSYTFGFHFIFNPAAKLDVISSTVVVMSDKMKKINMQMCILVDLIP